MRKILIILFVLIFTENSYSATSWYTGKINRLWPFTQNGGFIITFESPSSVSDCKHGYVYFRSEYIQADKMKNSMSLALSAFHSGSTVGVIIDKDLNGEYCWATDIDLRR